MNPFKRGKRTEETEQEGITSQAEVLQDEEPGEAPATEDQQENGEEAPLRMLPNLSTVMHMALINGAIAQALARTRSMSPDMCRARLSNLTPAVFVVGTSPHPADLGPKGKVAFIDGVKQRWILPEEAVSEFVQALLDAGVAMSNLAAVFAKYRI